MEAKGEEQRAGLWWKAQRGAPWAALEALPFLLPA